VVTSLTEYVQVEKQLLENILKEVGTLRKLAASTPAVIEEVRSSCSAELAAEPK
jgi:hypothetical protein